MAQTVSLWWSERSADHFRGAFAPRKRGEAKIGHPEKVAQHKPAPP